MATDITLKVVPPPNQIIQINRGVSGGNGNNNIGGYPVNITNIQQNDALMWRSNFWVNVNQLEITDGGNF
jgi:hypothetical protein